MINYLSLPSDFLTTLKWIKITGCLEVRKSFQKLKTTTMVFQYVWVFKVSQGHFSAHMTLFGASGASQSLMSAWWLALMACVKATLAVMWLRTMTGKRDSCQPQHHSHTHAHTSKRNLSTLAGALQTRYPFTYDSKMAPCISTIFILGHYCVNYLAGSWQLLLPPCSVP